MKFKFECTQPADTYFKGTLEIEAESEEAAENKIMMMTNRELDALVNDWEAVDEAISMSDLPIEVWDKNGKQLNGE